MLIFGLEIMIIKNLSIVACLGLFLAGCSSNIMDNVASKNVSADATQIARYGYLKHHFTIITSKVTTNGAYDVTVKREGKPLNKGFDDGLLAKTAAREFFSTVGPCKGRKAYAIPHKILFAGKGVWGMRLRCS